MHHDPPPPSSLPQNNSIQRNEYRKAKPLPVQLLDHCTVCLEEQLFSQAFSLLSSSLTAGTSSIKEAHVPPPQHLALAATLIVHPQLTTRTTSPDKHAAADDALRYLQHVNSLVGSLHAGLDKAFRFSESSTSSRGKRINARVSGVSSEDEDADPGRIRSSYVDKDALWTHADDFWDVVGWAFNCSVVHPNRWERWKLWLDLMLDVLEGDLEARVPDATKAYQSGGTDAVREELRGSLFSRYLSPIGEGRNNKRRLMRAIVADGKSKSLAEFGEIWRHETKPPKQKQDERLSKKRKLDLENGEFGDYFDDESDEESLESSVRRSRSATAFATPHRSRAASEENDDSDGGSNGATTPSSTAAAPGIETFGGLDSIHLRQRILALLTRFCSVNPDAFLDNEDLFDLFTEFLRPLPLPVFQQFLLPTKPYLGPNSQASLSQMLLRPLLVATAPPYNENALTQAEFEEHYAPYEANNLSAVENAKVSLLIESLLRLLWSSEALGVTHKLRQLVERGIAARKEKVELGGRKRTGTRAKIDEEAIMTLECSAQRMKMILDMSS